MSTSQFLVGFVAVAGAAQLAVSAALPDPEPITVHSLRYVGDCTYQGVEYDNCVEQDRTITADGEYFYMFWEAGLYDENGRPVKDCSGGGSWKYPVGRRAVSMPEHVWVGNDDCDISVLPPGRYTPIAVWFFGEEQITKRGLPFVVE